MVSSLQAVNDQAQLVQDKAAEGTWALEGEESRVEFAVKTFWGLMTVRGHFSGLDGAAEVGSDGTVTASLAIGAASVDTNQKTRDQHLLSSEFFDAGRHPRMEVRVGTVRLSGPGAATGRGHMAIAGHTQPVDFDATVTLSDDDRQATVETTLGVDRTAFGMTRGPLRMIAPTAQVTVHLVFSHSDPTAN
jgi:polyisoprenoid-binding protein YceI